MKKFIEIMLLKGFDFEYFMKKIDYEYNYFLKSKYLNFKIRINRDFIYFYYYENNLIKLENNNKNFNSIFKKFKKYIS